VPASLDEKAEEKLEKLEPSAPFLYDEPGNVLATPMGSRLSSTFFPYVFLFPLNHVIGCHQH
jgi:hypothetical protein